MEIKIIIEKGKAISQRLVNNYYSAQFEGLEYLRIFAGETSSFYTLLKPNSNNPFNSDFGSQVSASIDGFINYMESGLSKEINIKRQAEVDVVSDYLEQAQALLKKKDIHPAAACVPIGGSLEEFLKNWIESLGV